MSKVINMNNDLLFLHRHGNGIKLKHMEREINSDHTPRQNTVSTILNYPFNIFFINTESEIKRTNNTCAECCGFNSEKSAIGKSPTYFATKNSASFLMKIDRSVMSENKINITDEELIRKDGEIIQYLTIRAPWYSEDNKIAGIFGGSVAIGVHPLSTSLSLIAELGLLNANIANTYAKKKDEIYLSKQQLAYAKLLITGLRIKEIAAQLNLSPRTVETYFDNIKYKLNCSNKTELVLKLSEIIK